MNSAGGTGGRAAGDSGDPWADVALELARASDAATIVRVAAEGLRAATGAGMALALIQDDQAPLEAAVVGADGQLVRPREVPAFLRKATAPVVRPKRVARRSIGIVAPGQCREVLAVRLDVRRGAVGWLCAMDPADGRSFDEHDERRARALAAQVGMAYQAAVLSLRLEASEARYRTLVEQLPAVVYYRPLAMAGMPSFVSAQVESMFGYSPEEVLADPDFWKSRLHPDDRERVLGEQANYSPRSAKTPIHAEYRLLHKTGRVVWVQNHAFAVRDDKGEPLFVLGVLSDVTEARLAEQARADSELVQRRLVEANIIAVATGFLDVGLVDANDAFLELAGYSREHLQGAPLSWDSLVCEDMRTAFAGFRTELAMRRAAGPMEIELRRRDGESVPVMIGGATVLGASGTVIVFVLDLSPRKKLEQQLFQAQKMEAIGRLAGGVAHDFNNLLSVILTYGELIGDRLPVADPTRSDLGEIVRAGERARDLTRQLLAFSRQQALQPQRVEVDATLRGLEAMLRRVIGEDIELVVRTVPAAAHVDPGQLEQVLLNLVVNARDAMPHGGKLVLETRIASLDDLFDHSSHGIDPGRYVHISVSDTGCGMDRVTQARVFEPFFTTKEVGTGLGLATAYGIVRQSGGTIRCRSEVGRGTTFDVYLPEERLPAVAGAPAPAAAAAASGGETILLVEDHDQVRRLTRTILVKLGYKVLEAENGHEALRRCQEHLGGIDLVLTDVVMPQMSGPELANRLTALEPELRVLFMSGYLDDSMTRHGVEIDSATLLPKPFTAVELARALRRVLDE
jgi:PAS domain S-box-containing protein